MGHWLNRRRIVNEITIKPDRIIDSNELQQASSSFNEMMVELDRSRGITCETRCTISNPSNIDEWEESAGCAGNIVDDIVHEPKQNREIAFRLSEAGYNIALGLQDQIESERWLNDGLGRFLPDSAQQFLQLDRDRYLKRANELLVEARDLLDN
jgi:hypothetical protein